MPEKTFHINGIPFMVCARCTGLYSGILLLALFFIFTTGKVKVKPPLIFISFALIISDIILYSSGIYKYSKIIAFTTGIFSGSVVFIYILFMIEKYFEDRGILPFRKITNETD